jgi:hypothetical protein
VTSGTAVAAITGTIGSDRSLDLKVASPAKDTRQTETPAAAGTISMSGTLVAPVVETQ